MNRHGRLDHGGTMAADAGTNPAIAALNRIMVAWLEHNRVTIPYASGDTGLALHEALNSVAREFGYAGGEDGGSK